MPQHRLSAARVLLVWSGLVIGLGLACSKTSTPPRDGGTDRPNDVANDVRSDGSNSDRSAACTSDDGTRGKNIGEACGCGVQCQSGNCVDGYCCNSACTGTCVSCGLPSALGMCSPMPAGVRPRSGDAECKADSTSSCGLDGACDGKGACEKYPVGTVCKAGSCDNNNVSGIYRCDASNQCTASFASICAPFGCNQATGSCFAVCSSDADCISGRKCIGGSCGPKMNGSVCGADVECASTHCVDGYCCNSACTGACRACNIVNLEGTCTPLQAGKADPACAQLASTTCGTTGLCDEFSSCATFPATTICGSAVCTSATTLNTARQCDGISSCTAPEPRDCGFFRCVNGICPSICTLDSDCKDGHPCVNKSCGSKLVDGQVCVANADCQNGNCVDGVCCNTACTGACRSCSAPGSIGRCTLTPASGTDPRAMCASMSAATCGTDGKCDGSGNCRYWAAGTTVCATETCASDVYVGQSTCNASHQCIKPASQPCSPYRCNGTKCGTQCVSNVQCISPPNSCVNNLCGLSPDGASCSADIQCLHSHCVSGICCNSVCTGACQACNLAGSVGTCSNIASGVEPQGRCPAQPVSSCGTTGACTSGQCAKWPANSQCAAAGCPTAGTQKPAAKCDGAGTCVTPATTSCAPGRCDTGAVSCTNICTTDTQCTPPATCVGGSCGLLPKGGTCSSSTQCMAGLTCSARDNVCCDTACNGVCETCKPAVGAAGTCTAVQAGATDPTGMCVAAPGTCGLDGTCKGNNTGLTGTQRCRDYQSSIPCRSQSCAAGMLTAAAQCTGSGACPTATVTSCGGYVCEVGGAQCKTSCTTNADCMAGITCNTVTNKCGDTSALGAMCTVGTDCGSGFCADGHCCDAGCNGACEACNSAGHCGPVPDNTPEPMCVAAPPCGNTGNCRSGACEKAPGTTQVSGPTCNTMNQLVGAVFCNGTGAVGPTPAPQSCLGYVCASGACKTSCTAATDCVAPLVCTSSSCAPGTGGMMGSGGAPGTGGAGTGGMTGTGGDTGAGGAGGDTGGMGG